MMRLGGKDLHTAVTPTLANAEVPPPLPSSAREWRDAEGRAIWCSVRVDSPNGSGLYCTRIQGHDGAHAASLGNKQFINTPGQHANSGTPESQ